MLASSLFCASPATAAAPAPNMVWSWFDGVPNFDIGPDIACITQDH